MEIIEFTPSLIKQTLVFCAELKRHDRHPCSFWGYNEAILRNAVDREGKRILVGISKPSKIVCAGTLTKGGVYQDHWAEISVAVHPEYPASEIKFLTNALNPVS